MDAELQTKLDKQFYLVESQWASPGKSPRGRRSRVLRAASAIDEKIQKQKSSPPQDAKVSPKSLMLSTFTNRSMLEKEVEKMKHEPPEVTPVPINSESPLGILVDEKLQKELAEQASKIMSLQKENSELHQKNHSLNMELSNMRKKCEQLKNQFKQATSFLLEVAVEKGEEETLAAAIAAAQQADVNAVDLEKAEENLKTLCVMMKEQHSASTACELLQQKKTAFALVKNDDVMKSKELIFEVDEVGVSESVSWYNWRDPVCRTVWRYAKDLRADVRALRMQEFLKQLGAGNKQLEAKVQPVDAPLVEQKSNIDASECLPRAGLVKLFNSMFRRGHCRC